MKITVDRDKVRNRRIAVFGDRHGALSECATAIGMGSLQQYQQIEKGRRVNLSAVTLYRIAKALQCSMEDLMTATE